MSTKTLGYILKRLGLAVLTVWVVITATFFIMHAVPGGPFMSEKATSPAVTAQLEARQERERELAEQRRKQQQQQRAKTLAEKTPMTQEERLAEAVETEEINRGLLEQMLAVFEEKKQSQQFVDETFSGSLPAFVAAFASQKKLSDSEIDQLQALIEAMRGE